MCLCVIEIDKVVVSSIIKSRLRLQVRELSVLGNNFDIVFDEMGKPVGVSSRPALPPPPGTLGDQCCYN